MMHCKLCMALNVMESQQCLMQMEAHFLLILKTLSERWTYSLNSVLNIAHQLPIKMLSTECHKWSAMFCLMNFQQSWKQKERFNTSSGKAPGVDAIPTEIFKARGLAMAEKLTDLLQCMWRKEATQLEFKDAFIIYLYKRKEILHVCDNHKGISLLSIAGKVLTKIL